MRKAIYPTQCKDCGSGDVIRAFYGSSTARKQETSDHFSVILCAPCLQSRAQLQNMKEDKLPFHKLLAKIRSETEKRIKHICAIDGLKEYKGVNKYAVPHARSDNVNASLKNYWVEQLQGASNG